MMLDELCSAATLKYGRNPHNFRSRNTLCIPHAPGSRFVFCLPCGAFSCTNAYILTAFCVLLDCISTPYCQNP